jgi:uncharacterized protein YjaZ
MKGIAIVLVTLIAACVGRPPNPHLRMTLDEMFRSNVLQVPESDTVLGPHTPLLHQTMEATLQRVLGVLPVSAVTVTVSVNPRQAVPGYGIGGYSPNANTVQIFIDSKLIAEEDSLQRRLAHTLAHELHHAVRQRGPGYGRTLFEAIITEGLAERFAVDLLGSDPGPWTHAFPPAQNRAFLAHAAPEFDSERFDYGRWFLVGDDSVPRWTAYTLGYRLVTEYLHRHPSESATSLVSAPARVFPREFKLN